MRKLAELQKRLADLRADGQKILDAVEKDGRDAMTDDEQVRFDAIKGEIDEVKGEIKKAEDLAEARRAMDALPAAGLTTVRDPNPATTHGFKELGEFAVAVHAASRRGGIVDPRLLAAPSNPHQGGTADGEGYEVPPDFVDGIWEVVTELDEFGPLVDEEPTSKREVKMNADESTPWGASGVQAYWRSEGSQMTASKLSEEPRSVPLHELYAFCTATEELLEDAPRLTSRLTRKAGQAIAWKKNDAMVNGNGVGKPLGWLASSALVTVPKESAQSADTLVAQNVIKAFSRLLMIPGDSPFWLANTDTLPQLMTMTVGDHPIWMPSNDLSNAPGGFLLGRPVRFSEHAKTLGDLGDLQLVSPRGYYSLRRQAGPSFARSMHLYFDYATEAFRWMFRFGGQPHLSAPISPANGTATKSHFVAIAERA